MEQRKRVSWPDKLYFLLHDLESGGTGGRKWFSDLESQGHLRREHMAPGCIIGKKKTSQHRQCDGSGNVLLGILGFCHPCGCYFDRFHLSKNVYMPNSAFHGNYSKLRYGWGPSPQENAHCHAIMAWTWFEEREFKVLTWSKKFQILQSLEISIQSIILGGPNPTIDKT